MKQTSKVYGWTWLCDFGLCHWAHPTKKLLIESSKPSPEAKAIRVEFVLVK